MNCAALRLAPPAVILQSSLVVLVSLLQRSEMPSLGEHGVICDFRARECVRDLSEARGMNRRDFIAAVMAGTAASAIPCGEWLPDLPEIPGFDPTKQWGNFLTFDETSEVPLEEIVDVVIGEARRFLPKGTHFSVLIREPVLGADPFARIGTVAWKYDPRGVSTEGFVQAVVA